jgi:hypothetical protein
MDPTPIWYGRHPLAVALAPLSWLYCLVVWLRRLGYGAGWLAHRRLPVPVVVVGNLTVGGTGKTPAVLKLAELLRARGWRPGIITRGYGGRGSIWPQVVCPDADPVSARGRAGTARAPQRLSGRCRSRSRCGRSACAPSAAWTSCSPTTGFSTIAWPETSRSRWSTASAVWATDAACLPGRCASPVLASDEGRLRADQRRQFRQRASNGAHSRGGGQSAASPR